MILGARSLQDLSLSDFQTLIDDSIPAGQDLEYREVAYSDVREMLVAVTALANGEGGYLVMGVREDGFGRAAGLAPIDNPRAKAQAIGEACVNGIRDSIAGLEVVSYETGFNQGIIVIHVPPSDQRPHVVAYDQSTDFVRRYGTDNRMMTLEEIRTLFLDNPLLRQLVESELLAKGRQPSPVRATATGGSPYVNLLTERTVEHFLRRYFVGSVGPKILVLVSPFISDLAGGIYDLQDVLRKINADRTRTYVITRPPSEAYQQVSMDMLKKSPHVEIRYNSDIHAKLYVSWHREEEESYALFGSGNLTSGGMRYNIELGMMILARGHGKKLVNQLYQWSANELRTTSQCVKSIQSIQ